MENAGAAALPTGAAKQAADELKQSPTFNAEKPWHVASFKVDAGKLKVQIDDSLNNSHVLEFDCKELQHIQYIGTSEPGDDKRKLYAELIAPPGLPFAQQSNKLVYLGEIDSGKFRELRKPLEEANINWIRYTNPLRTNIKHLLPKTWGLQRF